MPYRGHVANGVVVLDETVDWAEGTVVTVEARRSVSEGKGRPLLPPNKTPLRGTPLRYDKPFEPAADPDDWKAIR